MMLLNICNRIIEYSFYALFLLVPLAFTSKTSELFELNKIWLTWGLTIIIGASWLIKMILQKKFFIQRTPLDIPIGLFLLSQIISTIFSLDFHVSVWGYYSRFNGGLLSIISYIFLYYAFLSNFQMQGTGGAGGRAPDNAQRSEHWREGNLRQDPLLGTVMVKRLLFLSLISGLIVALWGLPSHFGYDPTCLIFRGTFDVSCWTADFMPKIRIFSTLGQPDWLAAYLAILIPIAIAFFINSVKSNSSDSQAENHESGIMNYVLSRKFIHNSLFIILSSLFYVDLLFTRARSGVLGVWLSLILFFTAYIFVERKNFKLLIVNRQLSIVVGILLITTFVIGTPISQLHRFTLEGIGSVFQKKQVQKNPTVQAPTQPHEPGGTESGDIRLNVWTGAINAWKSNPLFGTGVETFAFAYYKYKPAGQNLTSEWNFLYNKAHNEYLNYLATTGAFGLGTYLSMIIVFLYLTLKRISKSEFLISNQAPNSKSQLGQLEIRSIRNLVLALLASYISILVTNFFGFSVVITNIYLFMIPAFVFILGGMLKSEKEFIFPRNESEIRNYESRTTQTSLSSTFSKPRGLLRESILREKKVLDLYQWPFIFFIILASLFMLSNLFRFWQADIAYALGLALDNAGEYQQAYPNLHKAVELRGDEPVFKSELSVNDAIIATSLLAQKNKDTPAQTVSVASALATEAINTSNEIISQYPNNAVFWKTRTRVFYTLSQVDSRYLPRALDAIEKASLIAPNDANIWYNLGVIYGQNNNVKKGIEALKKTIKLKPDYRDAHYALGLFYHTASLDEKGKVVVNEALNQKALAQMQYILDHIAPQDAGALESIKSWENP